MKPFLASVALVVSFAQAACSGAEFESAPGAGDDSAVDSASTDATVDSAEPDSSSAIDSSTTDSTEADTIVDSPPVDAAPLDTGVPLPDVAGGCPAPVSMAPPIDVSTMNCDQLKAAYPAKVLEAKACGCEADCSEQVPRDFCNCPTIVSPAAPAYPSLAPMRKRWMDLGCTIPCPKALCAMPILAGCFPSSGGSGGTVCTTM